MGAGRFLCFVRDNHGCGVNESKMDSVFGLELDGEEVETFVLSGGSEMVIGGFEGDAVEDSECVCRNSLGIEVWVAENCSGEGGGVSEESIGSPPPIFFGIAAKLGKGKDKLGR